ncbi:MAG: RluA family pseudouridine synthase [Clostridia bacterium]|nr:RluA family pseudouridine synthase [Clostridia bacterium]
MINVLYDDEFIAVALKPSGFLSEGEGDDCFPAALRKALEEKHGKAITVFPVHRLDRATEGLMVYALTKDAAASLSEQITSGEWNKNYTALLTKAPPKGADTLCDLLYYDKTKGKSFVVKKERKGVKSASLAYETVGIGADGETVAVKVTLQTGRTHQIRVQFASRGMPLVGDRRYGAPAKFGNTLALCATQLSFRHPKTNKEMSFSTQPSNFEYKTAPNL